MVSVLRRWWDRLRAEWASLTFSGRVYRVSIVTLIVSFAVAFVALWVATFPALPAGVHWTDVPGWLGAIVVCALLGAILAALVLAAVGIYGLLVIPETQAQDVRTRANVLLAKLSVGAVYGLYLAFVAVIVAGLVNDRGGAPVLMTILVVVCALAKGGERRLTRWIDRQEDLHRRWYTQRFRRGRLRRGE